MKDILIVYYSRTGKNKKAAYRLKELLDADIEEIKSSRDYKGFIGFFMAGYSAMKEKDIKIKTMRNPRKYRIVVICSPIWAGKLSTPALNYIRKNRFNNIAFFSFCGDPSSQKVLQQFKRIGMNPVEHLMITKFDERKLVYFANKIKKS